MVEAKLILGVAAEDIPQASEIKTIIKDIWDIRMSKLRTSMDALMKSGGSYGRLDHLTMMEINSVKPLLPQSMDELHKIKMVISCFFFFLAVKFETINKNTVVILK